MSLRRDLYGALGVPTSASAEEIRSAYRRLARELHPDVNPDATAAERFKEASAAYDVLSDPSSRALYDEFGDVALQSGFDPDKARAMRDRATAFDLGGLGDLFGFGRPESRVRGDDVLATVEIDLAEALHGTQVQVRVPAAAVCTLCRGRGELSTATEETCSQCAGTGIRDLRSGGVRLRATCSACSGRGRSRTPCDACGGVGSQLIDETVTARIPAGADHGSRLRIHGRGAAGPGGGPRGDLIIETQVRQHPHFRRDGLDLVLRLPVSVGEAYNGAWVRVPAPDGSVKVKIPPHSQSGSRLRLKNKGVTRGATRGDLYVELDVRLPDVPDSTFGEAARRAESLYAESLRDGLRL